MRRNHQLPVPSSQKAGPLPAYRGACWFVRADCALTHHPSRGAIDLLVGKDSTETALRKRLPNARFAHLATHGFCVSTTELARMRAQTQANAPSTATQPRGETIPNWRTGIALGQSNHNFLQATSQPNDGILWASEMADLDLGAVELVTLSACQTAAGKTMAGEGMLGAQRALHVAGAQSSLTALWTVNDQSTRELMNQFYTNLWRDDLPKAVALQRAMIHIISERPKSAPPWRTFGAQKRLLKFGVSPLRLRIRLF